MSVFPYSLDQVKPKALGLIVLQADETLEQDMRRLLPQDVNLHFSRIPSGAEVTAQSLQHMEAHLTEAAKLLPDGAACEVIGYGCTSGTAQIGADVVAKRLRAGHATQHVTNPVSALIAACDHLGVDRLAILSPYIEEVSTHLRGVLRQSGIETPVFGSFEEARESAVVRISAQSVFEAGLELAKKGGVDAVFLSCTNLRSLDVIGELEDRTGLPVLSSNQVLVWHMAKLAKIPLKHTQYGRLLA